jgi:hypothetical protein
LTGDVAGVVAGEEGDPLADVLRGLLLAPIPCAPPVTNAVFCSSGILSPASASGPLNVR